MKLKILVSAAAILALVGCASGGKQGKPYNERTLATQAAQALRNRMQQPANKRIPDALINGARCIAVFPSITQAALIIGGKHGAGIVSCRKQGAQSWSDSAPTFYTLSGGSIGLQAGAQSSRVIMLFLTQNAVNQLLHSNFTLGTDIGIVAGPVGYNASIQSAPAPIVSYQSSAGVFAGISINGSNLSFDKTSNQNIYGQQANNPRQVLFKIHQIPQGVDVFNQRLEKFAPKSKEQTLTSGGQ